VSRGVKVTEVNDTPEIAWSVGLTENGSPVTNYFYDQKAPSVKTFVKTTSITDKDGNGNPNLASAKVIIGQNYQSSYDILGFQNHGGISGLR
jgi:hypothetical protein